MAILALSFNLAPSFVGTTTAAFYGCLLGSGLVLITGALVPTRPTWSLTACFAFAFALLTGEVIETMGEPDDERVTVAAPMRG